MGSRISAFVLALVILLQPGCWWCHPGWHHHCCKPPAPVGADIPAEQTPVPVVAPR